MTKFIVYLTFIPWALYFASLCKDALKKLENNKLSKKWLKENILSVFHFPNIILFIIFVFFSIRYYKSSQIWITSVLLFSAINLYLFINHYYDKFKTTDKVDSINLSTILIIVILALIPIIFYISTRKYLITYYILFLYSFFNYYIVYFAKLIQNFLLRRVFKNGKK